MGIQEEIMERKVVFTERESFILNNYVRTDFIRS